jgi:hypothetical protein
MHPRRPAAIGFAACLFVLHGVSLPFAASTLSCAPAGDDASRPPIASVYVVPPDLSELAGPTFFDHPWPSDLRLDPVTSAPRLEGYVNPRRRPILDEYVASMRGVLDGFSPIAAGFLRFSGPLDPASLPQDPRAAREMTSSVQLIDIDPASPERGQRRPLTVVFRGADEVYAPPNTLAFAPTLGYPLRRKTRYALVVTDAVRGARGERVEASLDLRVVLGLRDEATAGTDATGDLDSRSGEPLRAARAALARDVDALAQLGIARERVVHLAVFTTGDPTRELYAVRDHLRAHFEPPGVRPGTLRRERLGDGAVEYVGVYGPSPNYQSGTMPFARSGDGGAFHFVAGQPEPVSRFDLRFSLSVPDATRCPMPPAGYPVVLYAHGTGGDYRSYVRDGTARELAARCLATMGTDQIFHGTRPGAGRDETEIALLFFNFENIAAARTNARQSAIDEVQRARLFTETKMTIPASVSANGREVRFDGTKVLFFGHSQGGLNGPLFLAADDASRGGVLSGASGGFTITLREKTMPRPSVAALVRSVFLGLEEDEARELDDLHPALALAQMLVDPVDPLAYARDIVLEPRQTASGRFSPKSIYMTVGVNPDGTGDRFTPPRGIEVHAVAMGLPFVLPLQRDVPEASYGAPPQLMVTVPPSGVAGNLAGGAASGAVAQWPVPPGGEGHFVVFDVPGARAQAAGFLRALADGAPGRVPPR